LLPLLPIAFLLLGLIATSTRDLITWAFARQPEISSTGGDSPKLLDTTPRITLDFHDEELAVKVGEGGVKPSGGPVGRSDNAFWEPSMRFGLVMNDDGLKHGGQEKRLTFEPKGLTNNTVVKLDGRDYWFGERPFRREDGEPTFTGPPWPGRWRDQKKALGKDAAGRQRNGWESVWEYEKQHVAVTQTVEIVPGPSITASRTKTRPLTVSACALCSTPTSARMTGCRFSFPVRLNCATPRRNSRRPKRFLISSRPARTKTWLIPARLRGLD
jgi:hypothetical protein